jgi:hypothetical protein
MPRTTTTTTTTTTVTRKLRVPKRAPRLVRRKRKVVIRTVKSKNRRALVAGRETKILQLKRSVLELPPPRTVRVIEYIPPRRLPRPIVSEVTVKERQAMRKARRS